MVKIHGIKSVDFKIKAKGFGVVNWNGPTELEIIIDGKTKKVTNHSMPKLRGYSNIRGYWEDGNPKFKRPEDVNFEETELYISTNCLRHHLFKDEYVDLQSPELLENMDKLLCSITGLIRGYVIPSTEHKRTSPLLIEDFIEQTHNGNYEQLGNSGNKEKKKTKSGEEKSTSMFSKTTFGDTEYIGYASLSVEQLQFISLTEKHGRKALQIDNDKEGEKLASQLVEFIKTIDDRPNIEATYHKNYVRNGSIFNSGEAGILLNDDALDVLVDAFTEILMNFNFRQAKGYMYVEDIEVDYNDGKKAMDMMRIKHSPSKVNPSKNEKYAEYFRKV